MSRTPRPFAVLGFASTHDALAAEQVLLDSGIDAVPIPAPKVLGALCGIALRVSLEQEDQACARLKSSGIAPSGIIRMDDV